MVAAGTGLAPFIGFLQERKASLANTGSLQKSGKGKPFAKTLLFFGCRRPALDSLYAAELNSFEADDLVEVRRAFSRDHKAAGVMGCKYIDERFAASADELVNLWGLVGACSFVEARKWQIASLTSSDHSFGRLTKKPKDNGQGYRRVAKRTMEG